MPNPMAHDFHKQITVASKTCSLNRLTPGKIDCSDVILLSQSTIRNVGSLTEGEWAQTQQLPVFA